MTKNGSQNNKGESFNEQSSSFVYCFFITNYTFEKAKYELMNVTLSGTKGSVNPENDKTRDKKPTIVCNGIKGEEKK